MTKDNSYTPLPTDEEKQIVAENKLKKKNKQKARRAKNKLKGKQGKRNMPSSIRLELGRSWISKYDGEDIIRAYKKHFSTTAECAFTELKILGVSFSDEDVAEFRKYQTNLAAQQQNKKRKRRERLQAKKHLCSPKNIYPESDDRFFYIAGYTSGGAPYGVTWEEMGIEPYEELED